MSVYKDNATGKWRVIYRYTDITGKRKQTQKRGFETKREAVAWEHEMMLKSQAKLDMTFGSFYEIYEADKASRLKQSTWETKSHIIRTKILPYFADRKIDEIEVRDVIAWQNELLAAFKDEGKEERYSQDYLRTIQAQLTAIFAHAVKYYNLPKNPSSLAGTIGKEVPKEMQFWTKEEYLKFAEEMMDKPRSYYAFELLYWTGIRSGDDDDKIRLNQRKPSKYKGLRRFGPEKNLQRINRFMKERPIFYKNLIQMKENFRFYLRCFYCITKVVILQFNSENRTELARNG